MFLDKNKLAFMFRFEYLKGVLNPNVRQFNFELRKKLDFLK